MKGMEGGTIAAQLPENKISLKEIDESVYP